MAFVGISNWSLDASKMNRAITLSRPDPSIEDLLESAESISKEADVKLRFVDKLAEGYSQYYEKG